MAWTYNWTDTRPTPWSYATATETGKICRDPSCTFPAWYVTGHATGADGHEQISVWTQDIP